MAPEPTTREAKLIQYLNEAYGKEKELEAALKAHISMTSRDAYKKRLREHLKETSAQAKGLERRIKQLGGKAEAVKPSRSGGRLRGCGEGDRRREEGRRARPGSAARDPRHGRGGEAAQERQDRAVQRVRGDRELSRDRGARQRPV